MECKDKSNLTSNNLLLMNGFVLLFKSQERV